MRVAISLSWCFAALLAGAAPVAVAHHSFAMFDQTQSVSLQGVVTEVQWTNPHAFLHLQVADANGTVLWRVELNSPNNLRRQGWKADTIKASDHIKVIIHPLRDGSPGGLLQSATLADGTVLGEP